MAKRKRAIPQYGTVTLNGIDYYRTRVQNADGKLVALYARTPEELYDKELGVLEQIDNDTFCRKSPTVADYCEKWLLMQSVHVRATTLIDYTSKVRRHIIKELGQMRMADVTLDDIQLALVPVSEKSASVYKSVVILYKSIFRAAKESKIIDNNPTIYLTAKGGGVPQKDKAALTDEQAARLLDAIQGLPPYVFVMLGLYAGLRREEILALKWDSVYLDVDCPYLTVRRAWHTENNRPVILDELKTKAAHRNIPLPVCLADCLKETKANSQSEYVVPNREGDPLSYTQFKRLWQYIVTRTVKERFYYRYQTATAALCSLSAGSYSGRTGHTDRFGSLLCHRLYRQEYHSPSGLEAALAEELPPCNRQHFRQTAKKSQAAGLFRRWHGFSCSDLRVFCRCCLMSDFCSLSYSTTCLHGCFDRR